MAELKKLNAGFRKFIEAQSMFFVATADTNGRVNVSPKGLDTLRVVDEYRIIWLSLSGSGNETAAHVKATGRMTLMFCAFEGDPRILRVYGQSKVHHPRDPEWNDLISDFPVLGGSRQIYDLSIELVQTSCGTGVPVMEFRRSRGEEELEPFFAKMGENGVKKYWLRKNAQSIDGKPTGIFED